MATKTSIEWTDATWNPVRGCSLVSAGCVNCYAMKQAHRFSGPGQPYEGLTYGPRWTGKIKLVPEALDAPLHWKKPRRVFVNSMSDLFHEDVPDEFIDRVFETICACRGLHTFQILTKRPVRMLAWCKRAQGKFPGWFRSDGVLDLWQTWLGVSVENQATAAERIPVLLQTPAAVRFVSAEPLLGEIDLRHIDADGAGHRDMYQLDALTGKHSDMGRPCADVPMIHWGIVGGESGPGARACDVAWIRSIKNQFQEAGVPVFVKQLGTKPFDTSSLPVDPSANTFQQQILDMVNRRGVERMLAGITNKKGGDIAEWPEDLRVREWPR